MNNQENQNLLERLDKRLRNIEVLLHEANEKTAGPVPNPGSEYMRIDAACDYIKAKKPTMYRMLAEGIIEGYKPFGIWLFKRSDLDRWIEENG